MARGGGNRSRLLLVILLVTSLFLITLDLRGVTATKSSRSATQGFLAPIQKSVSNIFSPIGRFFGDVKNFPSQKRAIENLQSENARLKTQVLVNKDIQGQLKELRGVLDLAGRGGYRVVSARVVGHDSASSFSQTITIDAGSADHISVDKTVISEHGLVGVVTKSIPNNALVYGNPAKIKGWVCSCGMKLRFKRSISICKNCGKKFTEENNITILEIKQCKKEKV